MRPRSRERPEDPRWREAIGRKCGYHATLNHAMILGADQRNHAATEAPADHAGAKSARVRRDIDGEIQLCTRDFEVILQGLVCSGENWSNFNEAL